MKKYFIIIILLLNSFEAKAFDFIVLLEIAGNTLRTLSELSEQTNLLKSELAGIRRKITRVDTISKLMIGSDWSDFKNPKEASKKLSEIYFTLPDEYRTKKSDMMALEILNSMNLLARTASETQSSFKSGKEMERRALYSSPGVAQKIAASGVGTIISQNAQSQVMQAQLISLVTAMLAQANEQEARKATSMGNSLKGISQNLDSNDKAFKFSNRAKKMVFFK